jgi:hypothetical protein
MQAMEVSLVLQAKKYRNKLVTVPEALHFSLQETILEEFMNILVVNNILSAPVLANADGRNIIVGSLSIHEVLEFLFNNGLFEQDNTFKEGYETMLTESSVKDVMVI